MNVPVDPVDSPEPLPAIILCGGRSRRMGTDKIRLPLAGNTVYGLVEEQISEVATELVVVTGHAAKPPPGHRAAHVVADEIPDLGPLEGLRVGLGVCQRLGAERALVTTGDAPLVIPDLYRFMASELDRHPDCSAAVPWVDGTWHPLTAVYRIGILKLVQQRVDQRQLRVKEMVDQLAVVKLTRNVLEQYDPRLQSLRNINTPEQYRRLQQELE